MGNKGFFILKTRRGTLWNHYDVPL
jgi:hypothetical protein